jgi:hypothetical protein
MKANKALRLILGSLIGLGACSGKSTPERPRVVSESGVLDPLQFAGADIGAQVNAACAAANGEPVEVVIPSGTYCLQTQINPPSHCSIRGTSSSDTILNANTDGCTALGVQAAIRLTGTATAYVTDVRISDLALTNGTPLSYGALTGMDGIRADYCDRCTFQSLFIHSIAGYFALVWKNSTYVVASDNRIANFYYAGITGLGGNQYEWIQNNQISGAVNRTGDQGLAYGIGAAGYEHQDEAAGPFTQHAWITNNIVSDIPTWECYDTHGGSDQHFIDNQGTGCYFGIQAGSVLNLQLADAVLDNIEIAGNQLDRAGARANGYGIVVAGAGMANPVTNATVTGNVVKNFGSSAATTIGAITLMATRKAQITNNQIDSYFQAAILLYANNWNTTIIGNTGRDLLGSPMSDYRCMIALDSIGNWGLRVDGNVSSPSSSSTAPDNFFCDNNLANHVSFGPTNNAGVLCSYPRNRFLPICLTTNPPTALPINFVHGDVGYADSFKPAYVFSSPAPGAKTGYFSMDTTDTIATGNLTANSTTISGLGGGAGGDTWYYWFPSGMNITIAGAGDAGAPLAAQVVANDGNTITLDKPAATSVNGAKITWQGGVVTALP